MSMQVTVTLPDNIYRQAEQVAQTTNQPIADVLAETISRAFPPLHINENRAKMEQEIAAFETLHADLQQTHLNQFVVVRQGVVIDHDFDELALVERIEAQYPDEIVLIRQVLPQIPSPLRFRSPRFVNQS